MKKIMIIAIAMFILTSCQPTPEQNVVVEKDTERMVEQAMPESKQEDIPTIGELVSEDRYVYEETGADGKLTLTMDAEIVVPDVDYMPIAEVSKDIFTQEQVSKMFNYFFPSGEATIDMPQVELKSDIERAILETKQELAKTEDATQRKELEDQIEWMEEYYLEAPAEQPQGRFRTERL